MPIRDPDRSPLGGLPVDAFLAEYWQKKPLLIRGAVPGFADPIDPETLAGLACEEDAEARIVLRRHRGKDWVVRDGPFDEAAFARLPAAGWTLLVQAVDHWVPAVAALRDRFRFIPDWRIDDVMVSYAVAGGGVGPHVDHYDVFLLQGRGVRRWRIAAGRDAAVEPLPHDRLRLLRRMPVDHDWLLEPGDMLYLPPGVAHDGVAEDACLTYSIGFRAPSVAELAGAFAEHVAACCGEDRRYADPGLAAQANSGEIAPAALEEARRLIRERLGDEEALACWFGALASEPKDPELIAPRRRRMSETTVRNRVRAGAGVLRRGVSRLAFVDRRSAGGGEVLLFVNGDLYRCSGAAADLARLLGARTAVSAGALAPYGGDDASVALLAALVNAGALDIG